MSKLVNIALIPLLVLTFFAVIFGSSFVGVEIDQETISTWLKLNNTLTESRIESIKTTVNIDPLTGAIAIIIALAMATSIIGLRVLGSGLSDESVRTLTIAIIYTSIWTVLSVLAYPLFAGIELFGVLIYVALTIVFVIGVIEKIAGV